MMQQAASEPVIPETVTISWTGSGADKTSSVIDATGKNAYFTLPFVEDDPKLVSTATAESLGIKIRDTGLYTDEECTLLAGYWQVDNQVITSTRRTTANSPYLAFDTEYRVAPRGYYAKMIATRSGTDVFASNGNTGSYLNSHGTEVILK